MAMDPPWLHNSRPLLPPFDGGGMPSGLPGGGMWQPTESLPGPQPDAAGPLFPGFEFRDAATQAALEFSPATAKVLEAFQPLPICEPADAAGLQMTHDEWGVLQDVLRPEISVFGSSLHGISPPAGALPLADPFAATSPAFSLPPPPRGLRSALPSFATSEPLSGLFDSTSLPLPPRLRLSPEMGASSDARQQAAVEPAQMLEVQIAKHRLPNGQLTNVVRCTDRSVARMDPEEVAAQLARLNVSIATGALSLSSLGECRDSAQVPLPPGASAAAASISHQQGAGSGGGAAPAASAGSAQHARRRRPQMAPTAAAKSSAMQVTVELHEGSGQPNCTCKRTWRLPRVWIARIMGSARGSAAANSGSSARAGGGNVGLVAAAPSGVRGGSVCTAAGQNGGLGGRRACSAAPGGGGAPAASSTAGPCVSDLIAEQSVDAAGVMTLRLKPAPAVSPQTALRAERMKLAEAAARAAAYQGRSDDDSWASSSSESDDNNDGGGGSIWLHERRSGGARQPPAAAAARDVVPGSGRSSSRSASASAAAAAAPQAASGGSRPALSKRENVSRITVEFLEANGFFDRPIQEAADQLKVGVTTLKKICRGEGIQRWPYRKRGYVERLLERSDQMITHMKVKRREPQNRNG